MGTIQNEGILGSHPNIFCQIYHAPGHLASNYPNRYAPHSHLMLPTYAMFNPAFVDE